MSQEATTGGQGSLFPGEEPKWSGLPSATNRPPYNKKPAPKEPLTNLFDYELKTKYHPGTAEGRRMYRFLERLGRIRLSKNFILRQFLYSTEAAIQGNANLPSDNVRQVIRSGKAICQNVLEPVMEEFGMVAVTFGYQTRRVIEGGTHSASMKSKPNSSCPHQWDRGTFGDDIYARVDFSILAVEDGLVDRYDAARWMMHNLDLDLVMQWTKANIYCVTIGPKPRRVWQEWCGYGDGDTLKGNCRTFMGEQYWRNVWPHLPESERPKFGPSCTGGKMWWGK